MNTLLSEDEDRLETFCLDLLAGEWPLEKAIASLGPDGAGHSAELWKTLSEAGWLGLPFTADLGGADGTLIDLGMVYRAAGAHLVPSSFYASMFAGLLIDRIATEAQKSALLKPIIAGEVIATVAYSEPHASEDTRLFVTTARLIGDEWEIQGTKAFVPHLAIAEMVLVLAKLDNFGERNGWGLFALPRDRFVGGVKPRTSFGGEKLSSLELDLRVPRTALLGTEDAVTGTLQAFEDVVETATALQCMEMVGGASAVLTRTVDYVTQRHQHGRAIGSFQAVQHMLANVSMQLDGARVAALHALYQKSQRRPATRSVSIAKIALGETYTGATIIAQQLWGSMGYARETGLYLWSERAKVTDLWFGTRTRHLRRLADAQGL